MKKNKNYKQYPITIILDNIRSAYNVGAIFRTCDAAGISKLYLCGITPYPPHNKIPKTALGATKTVNWLRCETTEEAIEKFKKEEKGRVLAVEKVQGSVNFWKFNYTFPLALIFGHEVTGISKTILKLADGIIKIPMFGEKESLNVETACGIAVYEVIRKLLSN
jgi:23S rRNA (guanosine2251-2'-O)-methyltransferase